MHEIHQKQRNANHGTYRIATLEFSDDVGVIAAAPDLRATLETIMLKAVRQQAAGGDLIDFQDRLRECADLARAALARADV